MILTELCSSQNINTVVFSNGKVQILFDSDPPYYVGIQEQKLEGTVGPQSGTVHSWGTVGGIHNKVTWGTAEAQ